MKNHKEKYYDSPLIRSLKGRVITGINTDLVPGEAMEQRMGMKTYRKPVDQGCLQQALQTITEGYTEADKAIYATNLQRSLFSLSDFYLLGPVGVKAFEAYACEHHGAPSQEGGPEYVQPDHH